MNNGRTLPGFAAPLPPGLRETIDCTGCGRRIPAPPQAKRVIQCKVCKKIMQVVRIQPTTQKAAVL